MCVMCGLWRDVVGVCCGAFVLCLFVVCLRVICVFNMCLCVVCVFSYGVVW